MAISQFPETEGETSRGIHAQISENFVKENLFHPSLLAGFQECLIKWNAPDVCTYCS